MKLALLCSVAFLAAASPVMAADIVEPVAAMPFSWTGFYVGGQAGGAWNDSHWSGNFDPFDTDGSGGIFGGQIGYNYQIDQYVIGIEGNFAGSSVKGDNQCSSGLGTVCEAKQDYLGSVRGRLGYAFDRFLVYGDGGVAFTKYKFAQVAPALDARSFGGGSRVGWTAGVGVEYAFTDHWTAGVEWNYYDFGTKDGSPDSDPIDIRATENVVVGKINYKF